MVAFKTIFKAGILNWWADKKSIKQRLIYFPIILPFAMLITFALVSMAVHHRSTEGGGVSNSGKVVVAVQQGPYAIAIADQLSSPPTNYEILLVDHQLLEEIVSSNEATFSIKVEELENNQIQLTLLYDYGRNYIHKEWIRQTKNQIARISTAINSVRFGHVIVDPKSLELLLQPISVEAQGFGDAGSVSLLIGLMFLFWIALFLYPFDTARGNLYKQFVEDITHDHLPIWKTARVHPNEVILGRICASLAIYTITAIALLIHILIWAVIYLKFIEFLQSMPGETLLSTPKAYQATVGFKDFVNAQSFGSILGLIGSFIALGFAALSYITPATISSKDTEEARSKSKVFDFATFNVPTIGFLLGYSGPSLLIATIPIINAYHLATNFLSGNGAASHTMIFMGFTIAFVLLMLKRSARKIASDERYLASK